MLKPALVSVIALASFVGSPAKAETGRYSASDGPVSAGFHVSVDQPVEFHLYYTGGLYRCTPPHYEGTRITAVFTFGQGDGRFPYEVSMGRSCTTPWSYMLPTVARIDRLFPLDGDDVLWDLLRTQVRELKAPVGIAFRDEDGNWDSRYGRNYQLHFQRKN